MYNVREVNEEQLFLWLSSSALFLAAEAAGSSFSERAQCIVPDIVSLSRVCEATALTACFTTNNY